MSGELWQMTAYYGPEANALWRRKHRKDPRCGPIEGELAIQVQGPQSVADVDAAVARERADIGRVDVRKLR
jgi:hypothetical protein